MGLETPKNGESCAVCYPNAPKLRMERHPGLTIDRTLTDQKLPEVSPKNREGRQSAARRPSPRRLSQHTRAP